MHCGLRLGSFSSGYFAPRELMSEVAGASVWQKKL